MNNQKSLIKVALIVFVVIVVGVAGYFVLNNSSKVFSANPSVGPAPLDVVFNVFTTDSDENSGIYYTIIFGDGEAAGFSRTSNPTLSHKYSAPGTYTVIVTRNTQCSSWECLGPSTKIGTRKIVVQ